MIHFKIKTKRNISFVKCVFNFLIDSAKEPG